MTVGHAATSLGSTHEGGIETPRAGSGTCSVKLGSSEPQPNVSSDVDGIATLSPAGFLASISIRHVVACAGRPVLERCEVAPVHLRQPVAARDDDGRHEHERPDTRCNDARTCR